MPSGRGCVTWGIFACRTSARAARLVTAARENPSRPIFARAAPRRTPSGASACATHWRPTRASARSATTATPRCHCSPSARNLNGARQLLKRHPVGWTAREAVTWLLEGVRRTQMPGRRSAPGSARRPVEHHDGHLWVVLTLKHNSVPPPTRSPILPTGVSQVVQRHRAQVTSMGSMSGPTTSRSAWTVRIRGPGAGPCASRMP
jgi:hypothetical protein